MAKKKTFENIISNLLGEPVCNLCHAFYDQYVEANVKFRSKAGMKEVIIRRQLGKCCKWCADLAGIYTPENAPDDIYRRHDNCKCMVTYRDENGYTDVWSKKEFNSQKSARMMREKEIQDGNKGKIDVFLFTTKDKKTIMMTKEQKGKKFGKHCLDYGLDPAAKESRDWLEGHIREILLEYDYKLRGTFAGQGKIIPNSKRRGRGKVYFYIKNNDVVVVDSENRKYITVLKDGINNTSVKVELDDYLRRKRK